MKKTLTVLLATLMLTAGLTACTGGNGEFDKSSDITVVSREKGSGTHGAFIELMKIEEKGADGTKTDKTTSDAIVVNKTDVMLTNISGDSYAVGYVSLGSLNNSVKAVKVDGAEATSANVKNGTYKVSRPFNIAVKADLSDLARDFIDFILSKEGQTVVAQSYISVNDNAPAYSGTKPSGKIVVAGSSSVTPVMEKLKEAYLAVNTNAAIEIQMSDSTAGITGAQAGTCDIGMASRNLKDSEKADLTSTEIALDGIAIIVNPQNPISSMTSSEIKEIFTGKKTTWSDISE